MCGRFTQRHPKEDIAERFDVPEAMFFAEVRERYNVAPSQTIPAIVQEADGERALVGFKWGLVPRWAKDPAVGNRMINAKAETLAEKPSFRQALQKRRCLIPADGFCLLGACLNATLLSTFYFSVHQCISKKLWKCHPDLLFKKRLFTSWL